LNLAVTARAVGDKYIPEQKMKVTRSRLRHDVVSQSGTHSRENNPYGSLVYSVAIQFTKEGSMTTSGVLLAVAVACAAWATASAIMITRMLERRGLTTPLPFIGMFLFRNLARYRGITLRETGKVGTVFYSYVIPINAALILALAALALRNWGL
jgi:hypothetical protein